jgi:hypothetical protein
MGAVRRMSGVAPADIAGWLLLLGVLALLAALTSGALLAVLTVLALFAWIAAAGRSRSGTRVGDAPLIVKLAPAIVALVIAGAVAPEEWYAFTAVAIGFPLLLVWRHVYERRHGRHEPRRAS